MARFNGQLQNNLTRNAKIIQKSVLNALKVESSNEEYIEYSYIQ